MKIHEKYITEAKMTNDDIKDIIENEGLVMLLKVILVGNI